VIRFIFNLRSVVGPFEAAKSLRSPTPLLSWRLQWWDHPDTASRALLYFGHWPGLLPVVFDAAHSVAVSPQDLHLGDHAGASSQAGCVVWPGPRMRMSRPQLVQVP
jgi:hypothetical protein